MYAYSESDDLVGTFAIWSRTLRINQVSPESYKREAAPVCRIGREAEEGEATSQTLLESDRGGDALLYNLYVSRNRGRKLPIFREMPTRQRGSEEMILSQAAPIRHFAFWQDL